MHQAYLSLGSNLGDRERNLKMSVKRLSAYPLLPNLFDDQSIGSGVISDDRALIKIDKISSIYESSPIGYIPQGKYLNIALKISTLLAPIELLQIFKAIELDFGRDLSERQKPRAIDIDIIFFDLLNFKDKNLQIPHPRSHLRAFVLMPLIELDSNLIHPTLNKPLLEILSGLEDQDIVKLDAINY